MADDFQAGDTVKLKSGSPTMTIERIAVGVGADKSQGAWCSWFDQKNQPQKRWYPLTSLKKVDTKGSEDHPTTLKSDLL